MSFNKLKYKSIVLFTVIISAIITVYHIIIKLVIELEMPTFINSLIILILMVFAGLLTIFFIKNHISDLDIGLIERLERFEVSAKKTIEENKILEKDIHLKGLLNEELKSEINYCDTILNNLPEVVLVRDENNKIIYSNNYAKSFSRKSKNYTSSKRPSFDFELHQKKNKELFDLTTNSIDFENQDFYFQKQLFDLNKRKYVLTIGEDRKELNEVNRKLLDTINQLRNADTDLNLINNKFNQLLDFISGIEDFEKIQIKKFLVKVFNFMFSLIECADCGSVYIYEDGLVKFLSARGHDLDLLKKITIYREDFRFPHSDGIVVTDNIIDKSKEYYKRQITEASKPIKETLSFPIRLNNLDFGNISLDISKENPDHFTKEDAQMAKPIEKLINIIINIVNQKEQNIKYTGDILNSFMELMSIHSQKLFRHSRNVGEYASDFAKFLGFDEKTINEVYWSGLMHDLGFLGIPKEELNNPIQSEEFYQEHVTDAFNVMSKINGLENVALNILCHHENYDGSGYPNGRSGDEIPVISQIIALINFYDYFININNRSFENLFNTLEKKRDIDFESNLIDQLIKWVHKNENI